MSTTEQGTNQGTETKAKELTGTIKAYNLDSLQLVDAPYKTTFTPAENVQDAMSRFGNDEKAVLALLNSALETKALSDAKSSAFADGKHVPKTSVLKYINGYRTSPLYSSLVTVERGHKDWKEQYGKQTEEILKLVKDVPFIMAAIRAEKITDESDSE